MRVPFVPQKRSYSILKIILFALIAVPLNSLWVMDTGLVRHGVNFTRVSLFMNTIFVIFVLSFLNLFLKRFVPSLVLTKKDMLALYAMLSISSGIAGFDIVQRLYPLLGHAFYFATPENQWAETFHSYIPEWLVVSDKSVLSGYYKRGYFERTLYVPEYLRAWIVPSLAWASVTIAFVLCMLCINVLVRRQWTEHERLAYPLAQVPLEVIDKGSGLFKTRLLWIGFAVSAGRDLLNGLHYLYPTVPGILYDSFRLDQYFTAKPWNAIGALPVEFHPFAIGLAFFMPLGMSFSAVFFFWLWRLERVLGSLIGVGALRGFPFAWQQSIGVCAVILVFTVWMYRFQALRIVKNVFRQTDDDPMEMREYRRAILGFLLCFGYLIGFCYWSGMKIWVASAFFLILLSVSTVVTRIRAELGYPMHDMVYRPEDILVTALGTKSIGPKSLTMFAYLHYLTYAHRSNPQPHQLEAFKIGDRMKLKADRLLILAMVLATITGSLAAGWACLHTSYKFWGSTWDGAQTFNKLQSWLTYPRSPNIRSLVLIGGGGLVGLFLILMRRTFVWWPFHTAGYLVGGTWSMALLWVSIFLSWAAKSAILKFGGLRLYRRASPFFLGLVLGQFVMASFWGLLGSILSKYMYRFV